MKVIPTQNFGWSKLTFAYDAPDSICAYDQIYLRFFLFVILSPSHHHAVISSSDFTLAPYLALIPRFSTLSRAISCMFMHDDTDVGSPLSRPLLVFSQGTTIGLVYLYRGKFGRVMAIE